MKTQKATGKRARINRRLACAALAGLTGHAATAATGVVPVGLPFNIDTLVSSNQSYDYTTNASVAGDGTAVVAWTVQSYSYYDNYLLARRLAADGTPLGPAIAVDGAPGIPSQDAVPVVASDPSGNFVVVWSGYGSNYAGAYRLFAADGTPLTSPSCLVADCSTGGGWDVSMDNAGDFVVLAARQSQSSLLFFHADGTPGPVAPLPQSSGTSLWQASISMNRLDGSVVVTWLEQTVLRKNFFFSTANYKVLLQRYAADGTAIGTPIQEASCNQTIYITNKVYGCDIRSASVAVDDNGNSLVAWWQVNYAKGVQSSSNLYAHSYGPTGATLTGKSVISPPNTATVSVAGPATVKSTAPSTFVVAWSTIDITQPPDAPYTGHLQAFGLDEKPIGAVVDYPTGNSTGGQMTANGNGSVLGFWGTNAGDYITSGIMGQFFQQQ